MGQGHQHMIYDYKIVNCDKAIEILQKMKQEKETCCCKHGIYEAIALGYAIAVLEKLPDVRDES